MLRAGWISLFISACAGCWFGARARVVSVLENVNMQLWGWFACRAKSTGKVDLWIKRSDKSYQGCGVQPRAHVDLRGAAANALSRRLHFTKEIFLEICRLVFVSGWTLCVCVCLCVRWWSILTSQTWCHSGSSLTNQLTLPDHHLPPAGRWKGDVAATRGQRLPPLAEFGVAMVQQEMVTEADGRPQPGYTWRPNVGHTYQTIFYKPSFDLTC